MQKTAIIVPCYNEYHRLKVQEFQRYTEKNKEVHFIFVNDASTDGTQKLICDLCGVNSLQMSYLILKNNSGKAEAVRQGFLEAIKKDFENIGLWDADLSAPLDQISKFCEILNNNSIEIVLGSRVKLLGRRIERMALRHFLGRLFATFSSLVLGMPVYDTQCGAKIFKNTIDFKRVFSFPFISRWIFDVEILARYKILKKEEGSTSIEESAIEYPLEEWTHISGSKLKIRDLFKSALDLFKIYLLLHAPGKADKYYRRLLI